jgi:hypothetical protein
MDIEEILKQIDETCTEPFVTARFGENWKQFMKEEYLTENCDIDSIINIAWKQGRKAILLEKTLRGVYAMKQGHFFSLALLDLISKVPDPKPYKIRITRSIRVLVWIKNLFKRKS